MHTGKRGRRNYAGIKKKKKFECSQILLIQNMSSYADFQKDLPFAEYFITSSAQNSSYALVSFIVFRLLVKFCGPHFDALSRLPIVHPQITPKSHVYTKVGA